MTRLRLERPYDAGGIFRRLHVEVDGRPVARLKQEQAAELELSPGPHRVVCRMDWTSGAELDIELTDGEELRLEISLPLIPMWESMRRPRKPLAIRRLPV